MNNTLGVLGQSISITGSIYNNDSLLSRNKGFSVEKNYRNFTLILDTQRELELKIFIYIYFLS